MLSITLPAARLNLIPILVRTSNLLHVQSATAFQPHHLKYRRFQLGQKSSSSHLKSLPSSGDVGTSTSTSDVLELEFELERTSTLSLLEHINLNVPNHDYILDLFCNVLGLGLDPRRAANVVKGSGTVWANCGASQFHFPVGEEAQVIPGNIGLWYDEDGYTALKDRLSHFDNTDNADPDESKSKPFVQYTIENENDPREAVCVRDHYGNVLYCRPEMPPIHILHDDEKNDTNKDYHVELMRKAKQPILTDDSNDVEEYTLAAEKYGLPATSETQCKGVSYVEFNVPRNTASQIAEFYNCVFDAPTSVVEDPTTNDNIAIVAFGFIDPETGRSSQSLIFRETDAEIPPYDGHHVALYVGKNRADFDQAFKNVEEAGVLWVNPRFSDKVTNLNTAKKWKQFRFRDLTDLKTGKKIFRLEHEVRSTEHDSWPGDKM